MQGLIVAAGQGARLRPIAPSKPLALVRGRPLIERVVEAAESGGITEFVIVTGYRAAPLEAFLRSLARRRDLRLRIAHNPRWTLANGHSVLSAAPLLEPRFVLLMADHLFDPALLEGLLAEDARDGSVFLAVDRRLDNPLVDLDDVTRVRTDATGAIVDIGKGIEPYDAFDTGVFLAGSCLVEAIAADAVEGGAASISDGMRRLAVAGRAFTHDIDGRFWLDIDDETAHARAEVAA